MSDPSSDSGSRLRVSGAAGRRLARRLASWDVVVGLLVVVLFVAGDRLVAGVMTGGTVFFTLQDIGEILLLALPMTLLIVSGEIDLSVGSAIALSSCMLGKAFSMGAPMWLACVIGIATGVAGGAFNGFLVTRLGLGSLAVTIGTLALYRGLAWVLLGTTPVANFPSSWLSVGYGDFLGWLPRTTPLLLVAVAAFGFLLHFTKTGQAIYALGTNLEAARFSGIRTTRIKFNLFVGTGLMAGVGGVTYTLKFATATPNAALGTELAVIAAVLFGGVSIFGGVGGLVGSVNAVIFLGLSRAVLRLASVPPNVLTIVTGGLLLASVIGPAVIVRVRAAHAQRRLPRRLPPAGEPPFEHPVDAEPTAPTSPPPEPTTGKTSQRESKE